MGFGASDRESIASASAPLLQRWFEEFAPGRTCESSASLTLRCANNNDPRLDFLSRELRALRRHSLRRAERPPRVSPSVRLFPRGGGYASEALVTLSTGNPAV